MPGYRFSRLARKEEARNLRQAVLFGILTIVIIISLFFLGPPIVIKFAIFLGNLKSSSTAIEEDNVLAPGAPRMKPLLEATNSAQINVEGFADPGAEVEIFLNGSSQETVTTGVDGSFTTSDIFLTSGQNEIYTIALNDAKTSPQSQIFKINFDSEPPKLIINEPQNNTTFFSPNNKITIKGETEEEASVTVNDHLAVVDSVGKFSYYFPLNSGENKIKITATDQAGNMTEQELILISE